MCFVVVVARWCRASARWATDPANPASHVAVREAAKRQRSLDPHRAVDHRADRRLGVVAQRRRRPLERLGEPGDLGARLGAGGLGVAAGERRPVVREKGGEREHEAGRQRGATPPRDGRPLF